MIVSPTYESLTNFYFLVSSYALKPIKYENVNNFIFLNILLTWIVRLKFEPFFVKIKTNMQNMRQHQNTQKYVV